MTYARLAPFRNPKSAQLSLFARHLPAQKLIRQTEEMTMDEIITEHSGKHSSR